MKAMGFVKYVGVAAALGACVLPALPASAQTTHKGINARISEQELRIREGVRTGQLTPAEAQRLRERDVRLRFEAGHARITGGHMTAVERARLEAKLNHNSAAIHHEKHDWQHRHH